MKSNDYSNLKIYSEVALQISIPGIILMVCIYLINDEEGFIGLIIGTFAAMFLLTSISLIGSALLSELIFYKKSTIKKNASTLIGAIIIWLVIGNYISLI